MADQLQVRCSWNALIYGRMLQCVRLEGHEGCHHVEPDPARDTSRVEANRQRGQGPSKRREWIGGGC